MEKLIKNLPNIGKTCRKTSNHWKSQAAKLPKIGKTYRKTSNHWKLSIKNFQTLEELRGGKFLPSGVSSQRSQKRGKKRRTSRKERKDRKEEGRREDISQSTQRSQRRGRKRRNSRQERKARRGISHPRTTQQLSNPATGNSPLRVLRVLRGSISSSAQPPPNSQKVRTINQSTIIHSVPSRTPREEKKNLSQRSQSSQRRGKKGGCLAKIAKTAKKT